MRIDPAGMEARDLYRLMISVVVPRPIAWVSTRSESGVVNAAPFSYFQALSSRPPMIMIAIGNKRGGTVKDTRRNIEETGEFVVNVVSEDAGEAMVRTSQAFEYGVSEFDEVGITPVESEIVAPPRIGESRVSMECKLDRVLQIGGSGVCIGEIVLFHVDDSVVAQDGTVAPERLKPLGRLGGSCYAPLREIVSLPAEGKEPSRLDPRDEELMDVWRGLRDQTVAMARTMRPDLLPRTLGAGGDTIGRVFRHLAAATTWTLLDLAGRSDEDEYKAWDESWTAERLAEELELDRNAFVEGMRSHLPVARDRLRRVIRHEAWHQGQIAAALRDAYAPWELWRLRETSPGPDAPG